MTTIALPAIANVDRRTMLQRQMFQDAEHALKRGRLQTYRQLEAKLRDYPLHAYLKYYELKRDLGASNYKNIHRFLQEQPGTPLATRLHYRWLKSLARKRQWKTLIDNFYYTNDKALQCDFSRALLIQKKDKQAFAVIEGLWLTGRSLPKNCDIPIEKWYQSGGLSQELVWERIRLAMQSRRTRLALFLSKYLDKEDRFWVRMWAKVRRDPNFVMSVYDRFNDKDSQPLRWVITDGLSRMAVKDAPSAAQLWYEWKAQFKFSKTEQIRIERRLSLALVKDDPITGKTWLTKLELDTSDEDVQEFYILNAIQDQDWEIALDWMDRLSKEEQHSERWRYWRARALEATGRLEEARSVFLLNADSRGYYGFLSADRAGMGYHFDHRPISYSVKDLSDIEQLPAIERARELYALNRIVDARREWNHALQQLDKPQKLIAAQLAHEWNWHDRAIITFAQAKYWDDLEKRFPLAHQDLVVGYAKQQRINPAWAFAIIRQESAFTHDARSHAGAMGLMQLLPRTARQVARSLRIRFSRNDLLNANTNVKLGINYLKTVKDKFKGNDVLATAAYNAGHNRVRQWLPEEGIIPADIWIESVPFNETRNYLKRVMTYTVIYEQRLGKRPVPLLERMLPISPNVTVLSSGEKKSQKS
ncbi:MAG: transglycosylase SLT domain-containing protein [Thioalkalispiraceae bacterium]